MRSMLFVVSEEKFMRPNVAEGFRLSPQQQRLWSAQQASDGRPYLAQCAIAIKGALGVPALRSAIENVIERFEILRTTFHTLPGMTLPVQVIGGEGLWRFEEIDLAGLSPADRRAELEAIWEAQWEEPIDYQNGPVFRSSLIRVSSHEQTLVISLPARSADAGSLANLAREIACSHASILSGEQAQDQPIQYADFAEWRHDLTQSPAGQAANERWRKSSAPRVAAIRLPGQKEPGRFEPRSEAAFIGAELLTRLRAFCHDSRASIESLLLACFNITLLRLSEQSSVAVG